MSHNFKFKETSCLKNENVADAFEALIEMWNVENQKQNSNLDLTPKPKTRRKDCC